MRQNIFLIAVMALVGCGKKTTPAEPETNAEPTPAEKAAADKATAIKKVADEAQANAFVNTLGMKFVPVPGTEVSFCIWETRVKDYAAYAAANAGVDSGWKSPVLFTQADTHPVKSVNGEDAQAFCAWLTKKELAEGEIKVGQKYRLPTDAEWSMAVGLGKEKGNTPEEKQSGIKDVYPWGKEWPPPKKAGNYHESLKVDKFRYTSPVGSFAANKLGLHDMGGNVWEWSEDWNDPAAKEDRVLRGASFGNGVSFGNIDPDSLLSSYRLKVMFGRGSSIGFRCVLVNE
ncbi:MAG: SUMF1/EgtB/PvdO family nonheme iron enzyme [Verrucomicrobiota bacterium]|jgi:formylglycine-generating enzyme required for sulfatase activity|nr:SUMF1/EgtB/PvdO family nonheme iron enzyme [Verrucomicrobiota bacterium]